MPGASAATLPAEGLPVAEHLDLLFEEPPAAPGRAAAAPPPSPRHPLRTDGTRLIVAPTRPAFVSGHVQGAATRPNLIYLILIDIRRIRGVSPSTTPTPRSRYSATSIRPTGAETASRGARPRDRASGRPPRWATVARARRRRHIASTAIRTTVKDQQHHHGRTRSEVASVMGPCEPG